MIESGGTAPYATTGAVMDVIHAYRDRPIPTPIEVAVIERIGIPASLAPRTHQALRLLDLLDAGGTPTPAMEDLRKAGSADFKTRLAEVVRAAYAEIFTYRDPGTDDIAQIEDAFRDFKPVGMRPRMVRLFLGLCEAAGIIESAAPIANTGAKNTRGRAAATGQKVTKPKRQKLAQGPVELEHTPRQVITIGNVATASGDVVASNHLVIRGLLQTLPPVGAEFPDVKRKEWADAVLAAFNLIYVRPPEDSEARVTLTPATGGGESG